MNNVEISWNGSLTFRDFKSTSTIYICVCTASKESFETWTLNFTIQALNCYLAQIVHVITHVCTVMMK